MAESVEEFRKHLKVYWMVFGALLVLTTVTVAVARIPFIAEHMAIAVTVGLSIATMKASLVAGYFMHLIDDRKVIAVSWILIVTGVLFLACLLLPVVSNVTTVTLDRLS
ncbi:MAG: hypothetical protein D6729_00880 [Deltaproteobacteria bacterium]|nr:MAG: hypothetical protein D6729_00880 [Deltaproteobacteria bacterium]